MKIEKEKLILILAFVTSFFWFMSVSTDSTVPFKDYRFFVSTNPGNLVLGGFHLSYDFNAQRGDIHFEVRSDKNPQTVEVDIPNEVNFTGYDVLSIDSHNLNTTFDVSYPRSYELNPPNRIVFSNFNESVLDADFIVRFERINKTESIYPNGRFFFTGFSDNVYGLGESGQADGIERVKFSMGKYKCNQPCVYERAEFVEILNINNNIIVNSLEQKQSTSFTMSAFDGEREGLKSIFQDFFTGFLVSLIFLVSSFLVEERRNKLIL